MGLSIHITLADQSNQQRGAANDVDQLVSTTEEQNATGPIVPVVNLQWGLNICQKQQDLVCGELEISMI